MPISPGSRIGAYEVLSLIGEGGMGQVFRARDTRLDRHIAIKSLPDAFRADPERAARFDREAKLLATLNHPNIATIHGLEQANSEQFIVMELVEGETLAERIARGPIPLDETVPIARQIAEALEAAHEQGVVHRDLKPANIKLRPDGTVKVLDFGLAKALSLEPSGRSAGAISNSPTITSPAVVTGVGILLGTAAYMAPEQAKGRVADRRADIWAFGCVLFEMLTGRRAFAGEDVTDTIVALMSREPDWSALPPTTPEGIRQLLARCLKKDARARLRDIGDARIQIDELLAAGKLNTTDVASTAPLGAKRAWRRTVGVGTLTAVVASALTLALVRGRPSSVTAPVLRYSIDLPATQGESLILGLINPAVSPDGRVIAVSSRNAAGNFQVWIRALDATQFVPVPGTAGGTFPFWSPDGREIGFFANRKLMRVPVGGGAAREVANAEPVLSVTLGTTATWGADDVILLGAADGIYQVAATGGTPTRASDAVTQGLNSHTWPQWLPRKSGFLYTALLLGDGTEGALMLQPPAGVAPVRLSGVRSRAHFSSQGLVIGRADGPGTSATVMPATLSVHHFDLANARVEGPGTVLASDATLDFSASANVVVYRRWSGGANYRFEWIDSDGRPTGDSFETVDPGPFNLSRDGLQLTYVQSGSVFVRDLPRGVTTRLVQGRGVEPVFSPDGQRVAYSLTDTARPQIVVQPSSGGAPTKVYESDRATLVEDWSSDGRFLVANEASSRGLIIPLDGLQPPITYADLPAGSSLDESRFSPDGRWLIYNSSERGRPEVYVIPLPPTGQRYQLSVVGGAQGRWRGDGRVVYYLARNGDLMALDFEPIPGGRPRISPPRTLFATGLSLTVNLDQFAPSADGKRFLLRRPQNGAAATRLEVIVNWPSLVTAP